MRTRWKGYSRASIMLPKFFTLTTKYIFMKIVEFLLKISKFLSSDVRNAWFGGNGYEVRNVFISTPLISAIHIPYIL